jgi:hypothetical protein
MRSNAATVALSLFACASLLFLPTPDAWGQAANLPNALGTIPSGNVQITTCPPGGVAGTCYNILVPSYPASGSCYEVIQPASTNPPYTTMIKISTGASPVRGTVFFVSGGGGNTFYDTNLRYGINLVNQVLKNGYDVIQFAFYTLAGWQQAGNPAPVDGPRALACTYGTVVKWAVQNGQTTGALCATGHSSGSSVVAYALSIYGLGDPSNKYPGVPQFSMVEPTSGPPHARLDIGCAYNMPAMQGMSACGTEVQESYQNDAAGLIDPSYPGRYCSACQGNPQCVADSTFQKARYPFFMPDSVLSGDELLSFPKTDVHLLYGSLDGSAASPLGYQWAQQVTGTNNQGASISCIPDAPHRIADVIDGAAKIASDLVTYCVAQP